jgi:hypothetical protein
MVFCTSVATMMVRVLGVTKRLHMPQKEYVNRVIPIGALYAASLWWGRGRDYFTRCIFTTLPDVLPETTLPKVVLTHGGAQTRRLMRA